ncbi:hypothetical protein [Coleofasciculus sp. H7-2]
MSNNRVAADGMKSLVTMRRLSAAADQERYTEPMRPLRLSVSIRD